METVVRVNRGHERMVEVREHGVEKLVLMRPVARVEFTPGHEKLVEVTPPPGFDLAFDYVYRAPVIRGQRWWEEA